MKSDRCPEISDALPLERIFGNPVSKTLDFLIMNQDFDYSESDISRLAGVPARTLQRVMPCLLTEQLVIRTRKSSKTNMYKANFESKRTLALQQFIKATIEENLRNRELFKATDGIRRVEEQNHKLFDMQS
ncbi:MAG: hypothetical protein KGI07_09575 [Thaumarchaeota archaeon]|nr:hypothetical protein [Nitrososphaerota archaeon]